MSARGSLDNDPEAQAVLKSVTRAAEAGMPCPSNHDLAVVCGRSSRSVGTYAMQRLEQYGLIRVERYSAGRVVAIVSTGKETVYSGKRTKHFRAVSHAAIASEQRNAVGPWTAHEIAVLEREVRAGKTNEQIARMLGRTTAGAAYRANPMRAVMRGPAPAPVAQLAQPEPRWTCQNCNTRSDASLEFGCRACLPLRSMAA